MELKLTIFECRCCDATCHGFNDGSFLKPGWNRIARIDGPDAICPKCCADESSLDGLIHDGYDDAHVVPGTYAGQGA